MALFTEHTAQKRRGWPVVLPICLFHDPIKNEPWGNTTTLQSCFASEEHVKRSRIKPDFVLVDLVAMSYETIATHNKAAIVELALKYAYKRDSNKEDPQKGRKEYFADMVQLIKQQINTDTEDDFMSLKTGFKDALIEYMSYVCKGSNRLKNIKEVVNELLTAIPELPDEEKIIMEGTVDRLRQESLQEGIKKGIREGMHARDLQIAQMIQHLVQEYGVTLETIKASAPELVDEVMTQVSLDETGSISSSQLEQVAANSEHLGQGMLSMNEPEASGSVNLATASNSELGSFSHVNKAARTQ